MMSTPLQSAGVATVGCDGIYMAASCQPELQLLCRSPQCAAFYFKRSGVEEHASAAALVRVAARNSNNFWGPLPRPLCRLTH